jgi:choline dehydrogenase-like flavoprotein
MANQQYDAVIVGAGITGAMMAYKLVDAGYNVLVLDAGDHVPNVAPQHPVKQDNINKLFAAGIKDPSAPWPSSQYAPRPTSPGVSNDHTSIVGWKNNETADGNYMIQTGDSAFGSTYERMVGGTTKHWLGTCLRFLPDDFKVVSKYKLNTRADMAGAIDWPIAYSDIEPYYSQAEWEIGVSGDPAVDEAMGATHSKPYPMVPIPQSYLDQQLGGRVNGKQINGIALNVVSTAQGRNSKQYDNRPACMGNSSCVPICPINAKYDAQVHIEKAQKLSGQPGKGKLTVSWRSVAYQVTTAADDSINGVKYKTWAPGGVISAEQTATGRIYVIATHAIEAPKLLLNSPWKNGKTVANSSDLVGRNLMDHICLVVWGNFLTEDGKDLQNIYPFRGPLSTSGIEGFRNDPNQRSKTAAFRIEVGNDGWTWPTSAPQSDLVDLVKQNMWGTALRTQLARQVQSQIRFALEMETISCDQTKNSTVRLSNIKDAMGIPRPVVNYVLPQYTLDGYAYAMDVANQLFAAAGIESHTTVDKNGSGALTFTSGGKQITIEYRGAGHLIGTHRMGDQSTNSVVNKELQAWDHNNLYLVGCGVFPTTATSNPTLTAAALALSAADTIAARLKT